MKGWSPEQHNLFPPALKDAVRSMLLCQSRESSYCIEDKDKDKDSGKDIVGGGQLVTAGYSALIGTQIRHFALIFFLSSSLLLLTPCD